MHARSIRQLRKWLQRVEGRLQEWRVVTVGRSDDTPQRDGSRVHHTRAFDSSFSPVHRASSRFLPAARGFGYASVHGQIGHLQADEAVVGFKRYFSELLHHSEFDPLVAPPPEGALRASLVGDPFVGAPEHQNLN
jgi:hypothetical protein